MSPLFTFLFAAITIEGIVYYVKSAVERKLPKSCIASIILGIFVAINFSLDAFYYAGLLSNLPFVGNVFTGILLSRGSNYFFDTLGKLGQISKRA